MSEYFHGLIDKLKMLKSYKYVVLIRSIQIARKGLFYDELYFNSCGLTDEEDVQFFGAICDFIQGRGRGSPPPSQSPGPSRVKNENQNDNKC